MYISIQCQLSVTRPYRSQSSGSRRRLSDRQCVISLMSSRMESSTCLLMWNTDTAMDIYRRKIKRARNVQSDPDKLQHLKAMWVFLFFFFLKSQMIWHVTTVHWTTGYTSKKIKEEKAHFHHLGLCFFFFFCKYKNSAKYYTPSSLSALQSRVWCVGPLQKITTMQSNVNNLLALRGSWSKQVQLHYSLLPSHHPSGVMGVKGVIEVKAIPLRVPIG